MTSLALLAFSPVPGAVINSWDVWVTFSAVAMPVLGLAAWLWATGMARE